ncbi:hypothetical protein [Actinomadura fibrosa]|uniref:Uncharacterized protein n=1 Tax=Actinomadura fibrosa TaxID=111802 RepID=A0ABW2XQY0_9ACTN|nr:hypothetical protein [Actinomadura fibrosa]
MGLALAEKLAAFCRELNEDVLAGMVSGTDLEATYRRAAAAVRSGDPGPGIEADLDRLDELMRAVEGTGFYPDEPRAYRPLDGSRGRGPGALWWACPTGLCAGRGRVRPQQEPPTCGALGQVLRPRPLAP